MFEIHCWLVDTDKTFTKLFYNIKAKEDFVRKCKYSKKIKILSIIKYY